MIKVLTIEREYGSGGTISRSSWRSVSAGSYGTSCSPPRSPAIWNATAGTWSGMRSAATPSTIACLRPSCEAVTRAASTRRI